MKCLLVDPSLTMRRLYRRVVSDMPALEVVEASNGKEALDRCDESTGLVVTAWKMPIMDGLELARGLRARSETSKVRIVMISNRNAQTDLARAKEAGVDGYLLKPLTLERIRAKLTQLLPSEANPTQDAGGTSEVNQIPEVNQTPDVNQRPDVKQTAAVNGSSDAKQTPGRTETPEAPQVSENPSSSETDKSPQPSEPIQNPESKESD
jgi:CheY-like chemotaxis protein